MPALAEVRPVVSSSIREPRRLRDATPQEIISAARTAPAGALGALAASSLTALLMWASFTPLDWGPVGWVSLVPLAALVRLTRPTRRMSIAVYAGGLLFWLATLQWMRLGHSSMYGAWLALSVYLAFYFPVFVALSRAAVHRLHVPMVLAVPVVWTGLEFLRGHLMTGFSWYYLAHTQYRWIELIQFSDVLGTYGVSFLLALTAACMAEILPVSILERLHLLPPHAIDETPRQLSNSGRIIRVATCLSLFALALGYGYWRRSGEPFRPGPRVALVQGNVTATVKHDPREAPAVQRRHEELTGLAVRQQPDLIVWPETMFLQPLFDVPLDVSDAELQAVHPGFPLEHMRLLKAREKLSTMSQMAGAALIVGIVRTEADRQAIRSYNSAAFVRPDRGFVGAYDKMHLVVFGEYVPLADTIPWLANLTPYGAGFGLAHGKAPVAFEYKGFRFAPIICFEDTVPQVVRRVVNGTMEQTEAGTKRVDVLVNLTNDGWFHGSSELDQHLITAAFRSVECRTPMVRAVNTGISAFIDGDGVIRKRAAGDKNGTGKQEEAVVVDTVPLDSRKSLYLAGGDWFAGSCLACCGMVLVLGPIVRRREAAKVKAGGKTLESTR